MLGSDIGGANLAFVARRIEADIRAKGLATGDLYLSVSDAALALGVSPAMAHRAMNLLVSRKILVRQQGRGTFVGEAIEARRAIRIRTVYILLPEENVAASAMNLDALVSALRARLGSVNVQCCFIPEQRGAEYVREIVSSAQDSGQYLGAIPISCHREVYRYLDEIGGPVVVLGSLYSDLNHLASADIDYRHGGRLLASYLVQRGHQRMALMSTGRGRPGDHAFFDGISDALTGAGLPHNALAVRIFPKQPEILRAELAELLLSDDRPSGMICYTAKMLVACLGAMKALGVADKIEIVYQGQALPEDPQRFARVEPTISMGKIAEVIADMFGQLCEGRLLQQHRVITPVELRASDIQNNP